MVSFYGRWRLILYSRIIAIHGGLRYARCFINGRYNDDKI